MPREVAVRPADFSSADAQDLVTALTTELSALYPEQSGAHFRLDPEEVSGSRGAFVVATLAGRPVGCGGLRRVAAGTGEIKRMFVVRDERGQGVGRAVLAALEAEARRRGLTRLVLETGACQAPAIALYERAGFIRTPPYGEYVGSPLSVCMEKALQARITPKTPGSP